MAPFTPTAMLLVGFAVSGGVIGAGIAYLAWTRYDTPESRLFLGFAIGQFTGSFAVAALWLTPDFQLSVLWYLLFHGASLVSFVSWVGFVGVYTGSSAVRGWPRRLFLGWAGAYALALASNPATEILFTDVQLASFGGLAPLTVEQTAVFSLNLIIIYAAVLWSYWALADFYWSAVHAQRRQSAVILLAHLVTTVGTVIYYVGGFSVHPALDPTVLFVTVTVVGVAFALFRLDLFEVKPMAADVLFNEMVDPVLVLSSAGTVLEANDAAERIVAAPGERLTDACPSLADAIGSEEAAVSLQNETDGTRQFDVRLTTIADRRGRPQGNLLVLRDVTVLKRRERELERQNERLDRFTGTVSHDLRNPLNVASGNLDLFRVQRDDAFLDRVESAHDRMEALIADLLTLAQSGSGDADLDPVGLGEVVERSWEGVGPNAAELEVETERTVLADRGQLRPLLENLLRNAVEHGGSDVTVTAGELPDGFYIADDGPGIPPDRRDDIFEAGHTTRTEGTGFGLAIVKEVAEAHDWEVSITESRDGGARFEITGVSAAD